MSAQPLPPGRVRPKRETDGGMRDWADEQHRQLAALLDDEPAPSARQDTERLRDELRDEIAGHPIGSGYYATTVGTDEAREIADALLDGPLWQLIAERDEAISERDKAHDAMNALREHGARMIAERDRMVLERDIWMRRCGEAEQRAGNEQAHKVTAQIDADRAIAERDEARAQVQQRERQAAAKALRRVAAIVHAVHLDLGPKADLWAVANGIERDADALAAADDQP